MFTHEVCLMTFCMCALNYEVYISTRGIVELMIWAFHLNAVSVEHSFWILVVFLK